MRRSSALLGLIGFLLVAAPSTAATGTVCFPGSSFGTPGSFVSFGNPASFEGTFTIVRGTGVFKGARGSGTVTFTNAGDAGHASLSGTITLR